MSQIRVCVIGAGAAGLCAARHVAHGRFRPGDESTLFLPTAFEESDEVGGTWVYNPNVGDNIRSSMYENLVTNLPKEVMAFPDFPFPRSRHSFLHHSEVKDYLANYAKHFGLEKFIRFKTVVKSVKAKKVDQQTKWEVRVASLEGGRVETLEYDGVMVCNGHYSVPFVPEIPGIESFDGTQLHSHSYRDPEAFRGKSVVVLGAAASGTDIGLEITKVAKKVHISHNLPRNASELPGNCYQVRGVNSCTGPSAFVLADGQLLEDVDAILFCTGYSFSFPFVDETSGMEVGSHLVKPLYQHTINIHEPSMCFIGVPFKVCPFPQFHLQCLLFAKHLAGEISLPSQEEMRSSLKEELENHLASGKHLRHFHKMGDAQWAYNDEIARIAQVPKIAKYVQDLYQETWARRAKHLTQYKKDNCVWKGDGYVIETS